MVGSHWQVLVVEDEMDSRDVVRDLLHYHGVTCQVTETAEDALRLLQAAVPDMVVIDLSLPAMDGWGLLRAIQDDRRLADVPCVAMTAYHSVEVARKAIEVGFAGYFAKPIDVGSFVQDLVQILRN